MNAPQPPIPPAGRPVPEVYKLEFTGSGGEYFKIWIVNILLTILTLGIYSAWAKVRRMQYFYRNTSLAGASFDYHGSPQAILKGRAIAFLILTVVNLAGTLHPVVAIVATLALFFAMPWLLLRSFQFRMHNTSYRGLRFSFHGSLGESVRAFSLWPFLAVITLGLLWPLAHRRIKSFQHGNTRYGTAAFRFKATDGDFYKMYVRLSLWSLVPLVIAGVWLAIALQGSFDAFRRSPMLALLLPFAFFALFAVVALCFGPIFRAWTHNLVWNNTRLAEHRFRATLRGRTLAGIVITNFILTVVTLGFYRPFAQIRLARYAVENMKFACFGGMDQFVAAQEAGVAAVGEEIAEAFDIDIAL